MLRSWSRLVLVAASLLTACKGRHPAPRDAAPPVAAIADARLTAAPADAAAPAAPARVEHAVFELVPNRHAAHRVVDGDLVVDAGDVGFVRYTRFGLPIARWHVAETIDGERAARADRLASLDVPLDAHQARDARTLSLRVHGAAGLTLTVKVDGRPAAKVVLVDGWQTFDLGLPAATLVVGENQLVFETTGKRTTPAPARVDAKGHPRPDPGAEQVALAWLRLGPAAHVDDPRAAARVDVAGDALDLAAGAAVVYYVTIPEGAHLVGDLAAPACRVEVVARDGDDRFAGGLLAGLGGRVDLSPMAGRVVRLELTARGCPRAQLVHPRITIHGPDPQPAAGPPPRYIILWVMDALRADKLPIFTPGARAETPNLVELAQSSAVFRQYYVQGNESQTSHSSVWTSLYPANHNVRMAGVGGTWRIEDRFDIMAERLGAAGFYTAAVTGNGFVNEDGGYARGFDEFRNMMRETGIINGVIYGEKIVDAALARLDAHRDRPTFLFLGTIDTHGPWIARHPWIERYSPGPYHGPFQDFGTAKDLGFKAGSMGCSIIPPPEDVERLRAIYDSAVSYHDQQVGRLVAQLKSWGIWDQTMLIITADHGEELFEDRRCGHGGSLRDSLSRVPLLIHYPALFPGGEVIYEGAEGVDVVPTMLDAIGAPLFAGAQGRSLRPLASGVGRGWATPSYGSMYEYAHAMRIGRWKARVGRDGTPLVDDLVADPGETMDLTRRRPVERRMLTDNLGMFLALRRVWRKDAWGVVTNVTPAGAAALDELTELWPDPPRKAPAPRKAKAP